MGTNGSKTNRDEKELQRCADMVSVNTLDTGLANFRTIARKLLSEPKGGYHTRKKRMFIKALDAIDRALDHNERWAVQMALSLTIGSVRDFVASDVGTPEGGFEVTIRETQTRTRELTMGRAAADHLPASDSKALPGPLMHRDPAIPRG